MNILLDDVAPDNVWRQPPILPTIDLGLDEIFVAADAASGDFMPVLLVSLVRRGRKQQRSTVFSLS